MSDSINIPALRAKAQALRDQADEIDRHIDALAALSASFQIGDSVSAEIRRKAPQAGDSRKGGKPKGTLSMKWRGHFAWVLLHIGNQFTLKHIADRVRENEGREMRATEARRQFKVPVEHGYLEVIDENTYRMTDKLISLVSGMITHEGPSARTEGPHVGGVAERFIASDSKSDGVTSEPSPVGSNPTTSAPTAEDDVFSRLGFRPTHQTHPTVQG